MALIPFLRYLKSNGKRANIMVSSRVFLLTQSRSICAKIRGEWNEGREAWQREAERLRRSSRLATAMIPMTAAWITGGGGAARPRERESQSKREEKESAQILKQNQRLGTAGIVRVAIYACRQNTLDKTSIFSNFYHAVTSSSW